MNFQTFACRLADVTGERTFLREFFGAIRARVFLRTVAHVTKREVIE